MDVLPGACPGIAWHRPRSAPPALAVAHFLLLQAQMWRSPASGREGSLGDGAASKAGGDILTRGAQVSFLSRSDALALPACWWLRPLADPLSFSSGLPGGALDTNPQPVSRLLAFASLTSLDLISFPCDLQEPLGVLWLDLPFWPVASALTAR